YRDPEFHIRLRLNGRPAQLFQVVLPKICEWTETMVSACKLRTFSIDTYERELERYGGARSVSLAEDIFCADSKCVCEILMQFEANKDAFDLIDLAVLSSARLLSSFATTTAYLQMWLKEHATGRREAGPEYRKRKNHLLELLARNGYSDRLP